MNRSSSRILTNNNIDKVIFHSRIQDFFNNPRQTMDFINK